MRRWPLLLPVVVLLSVGAVAQPSADDRPDVPALVEKAQRTFTLADEDAVILLDETRETFWADGRRSSSRHTLVLIQTEHAIDTYTDLRVPYDSARQTLTVEQLRTFRLSDRRWTSSGPTARVETLPFAAEKAPDYASRREMMLLHDGVELPCVLETAYAIADAQPYRAGSDGLVGFARSAPALEVRLELAIEPGSPLRWVAASSVPPPVSSADGQLQVLTFIMGPLQPLPSPGTLEAVTERPYLQYSTWSGWPALGAAVRGRFDAAATIDDDLRTAVTAKLKGARTAAERARLVTTMVEEGTAAIALDSDWWTGPRSAARTWSTAYGHRLDRAVLAAALLREAGVTAEPLLAGRGLGPAPALPGLEPFDVVLWISADDVFGTFDPSSAAFSPGRASLAGHTAWHPGLEPSPPAPQVGAASRLEVRFDLDYDREANAWTGSGVLTATGALSPYGRLVGLEDEARSHLEELATALLGEAKVTDCNPESLPPERVVYGFRLESPAGERDRLGRLRLEVGSPPVLEELLTHSAVQLSAESRSSAVHLPAPVDLRTTLRVAPGDLELVRAPQPQRLANAAGAVEITVAREDTTTTLERHLRLERANYPPDDWPQLRALLLAEHDRQGRVVLIR